MSEKTLPPESIALLTALTEIKQQVYANYPAEALCAPAESTEAASPLPVETWPEGWWETAAPSLSSTWPWLAALRRWLERLLALTERQQQQNQVNHGLVKRLEAQNELLLIHSQVLRDLDRDQTRLFIRLAELDYRFSQLEARLARLEQ